MSKPIFLRLPSLIEMDCLKALNISGVNAFKAIDSDVLIVFADIATINQIIDPILSAIQH